MTDTEYRNCSKQVRGQDVSCDRCGTSWSIDEQDKPKCLTSDQYPGDGDC